MTNPIGYFVLRPGEAAAKVGQMGAERDSLAASTIEQILDDRIDDEGGPLLYGVDSEEQRRSFDSTCRKLYRFLSQPLR